MGRPRPESDPLGPVEVVENAPALWGSCLNHGPGAWLGGREIPFFYLDDLRISAADASAEGRRHAVAIGLGVPNTEYNALMAAVLAATPPPAPTGLTPAWVPLWPFRRSQTACAPFAEAIWADQGYQAMCKAHCRPDRDRTFGT